VVAGFQVSISGRFWVSTEDRLNQLADELEAERLGVVPAR